MRLALPLLLVACTSTRLLSLPTDPRLGQPGHRVGFVVPTKAPWRERVDPNTKLRLQAADGTWSDVLTGRDMRVDAHGVWRSEHDSLGEAADRVRVTGASPDVANAIAAACRPGASFRRDGDALVLEGTPDALAAWFADLGARYERDADALGTWSVHAGAAGWQPPMRGPLLAYTLRYGRDSIVGWRWRDVRGVEVTNLSGGKTLGAVVGYTALAVALAPLALVMRGGFSLGHLSGPGGGGSGGGGGGGGHFALGGGGGSTLDDDPLARGTWRPVLAGPDEGVHAQPLFTTGSRVRSIARFTASLGGGATTRGDYADQSALARVRFADVFELGGGVRISEARRTAGWARSTEGVFAIGLHLPLDAGMRFAIPFGFEAGAGGQIAHDLRLPWGLRYTSKGEHWFATVRPYTPQHVRLRDQPSGRWAFEAGGEIGASF